MPTDRTANGDASAAPAALAVWARLWRSEAALHAGIVLVLVAPLFLFATLPLYDLPNHIARQHVLFGDGAPGAAIYYAVRWRLIPNLALEGGVYLLHHLVSVDLAVRLCIAATVAQFYLGAVALNRTLFGRRRGIVLAAALFAYNGPLLFGFVNLCFGIGMVPWGFALWLRRRHRLGLQPFFALLASLILISHLFAFGVYAVVLGCAWASEAGRRLLVEKVPLAAVLRTSAGLLHLAVPLAIYAWLMPHGSHSLSAYYAGWLFKIYWLHSIVGFSDPTFDFLFLLAFLGGALCVASRLIVARAMLAPLAGLVVAYLALPYRLGEGMFVDYRLPSFIMLFLVASTGWRDPADRRRGPAAAFVVAMLALRLGVQFSEWAAWQPVYAEYRAAFALLPLNAKLLPLRPGPNYADFAAHPPLAHVDAWAVTERGAYIPNLFADVSHQLLVYKPPHAGQGAVATPPTLADAPQYDYLLLIHPEQVDPAALPRLASVAEGETFLLARILH